MKCPRCGKVLDFAEAFAATACGLPECGPCNAEIIADMEKQDRRNAAVARWGSQAAVVQMGLEVLGADFDRAIDRARDARP